MGKGHGKDMGDDWMVSTSTHVQRHVQRLSVDIWSDRGEGGSTTDGVLGARTI